MSKYESVIIIQPDVKIAERTIEKFNKFIEDSAELEKTEELGIKRLAYTVKLFDEGYYVVFYFESESDFIPELERQFRIDDDILKFMVIKVEE